MSEEKYKMFKVTCSQCNKGVSVNLNQLTINSNFFCSLSCMKEFRTAKPNVKCAVCEKEFHLKPSHIANRKHKNSICCSLECTYEIRKTLFLGENNHQFGLKGELNPTFKRDWEIKMGYIHARSLGHPFKTKLNKVLFHRLIVEENLRQTDPFSEYLVEVEGYQELFLSPDVDIHHINGNKLDNRICNLKIMTSSDHQKLHHSDNINNLVRDEITGRWVKESGKLQKDDKGIDQLIKKNITDAGLDIFSSEKCIVPSKSSYLVSTAMRIAVPENHVGLIWSRSGLSVKNKIEVGAGCIDFGFTGEVKVHLYNFGDKDFEINIGDRIAQLLTIPINADKYIEVDSLEKSERGENGFGSTGIR